MPVQEDYPPIWTCSSENKDVMVEVRSHDGEDIEPRIRTQAEELDDGFFGIYVDVPGETTPSLSELFVRLNDAETGKPVYGLNLGDFDYIVERDRYEVVVTPKAVDFSSTDDFYVDTNGVQAYAWVEIPTSEVEMWIEKGEAAARQKTAKVKFPTEWGETPAGGAHNSPRQVIERFDPSNARPFMFGRVKLKDKNGEWVTQHLGWIGGVGAAEGNNQSKMWIYDFAEFLGGVPAGETFNDPTIETAVQKIQSLIVNNTVIPLSSYRIIAPQTEEEASILTEVSQSGDIRGAGFASDSHRPFYSIRADSDLQFGEEGIYQQDTSPNVPGESSVLAEEKQEFDSLIIDTKEQKAQSLDFIEPDDAVFTSNYDTLLDIIDWFEKKTQAKIHFETSESGRSVQMVVDVVPSRRSFVDRNIFLERAQDSEKEFIPTHEVIDVIKNNALYEMKPNNTLHLRGTYPKGLVNDLWDGVDKAKSILTGDDGPPADTYPVVKVQVPALVEAANGVEVSGEIMESDAKTLSAARREAISELSDIMSETTEGEIVMEGEPRLLPHDKVVAYEVCDDSVQYEQTPVEYEVESVKHEAVAGETFKTRITVSVYANDSNIEVVFEDMVEVDR